MTFFLDIKTTHRNKFDRLADLTWFIRDKVTKKPFGFQKTIKSFLITNLIIVVLFNVVIFFNIIRLGFCWYHQGEARVFLNDDSGAGPRTYKSPWSTICIFFSCRIVTYFWKTTFLLDTLVFAVLRDLVYCLAI